MANIINPLHAQRIEDAVYDLRKAEVEYQDALVAVEAAIAARNVAIMDRDNAIRAALAEGESPTALAEYASLTRVRIYQIRDQRR
jgi:hypothetical protein